MTQQGAYYNGGIAMPITIAVDGGKKAMGYGGAG